MTKLKVPLKSAAVYLSAALLLSANAYSQTTFFQREQAMLEVDLSVADDVNLDDKQRATPVLVRMYELRSPVTFETVDYFSLQSNDRIVLGVDLLSREEFVLRPGESRKFRRALHPEIEAIGWTVGYKDLAQSDWRAVVRTEPAPERAWYRALIPAKKVRLAVKMQRQGIQLSRVD